LSPFTEFDFKLFFELNNHHANWLDAAMLLASNKFFWIPFYLFILIKTYQKNTKQLLKTILLTFFLVVLSDQGSVAIKNFVKRPRPCHYNNPPQDVIVVKNCGGNYGFVSSHASNSAAFATFFGLILFENSFIVGILIVYAIIVGYSRIYLGVHFPFDVIGGYGYGIISGILVYFAWLKFIKNNR
jgi:undecaprenyl-diphosphatase